MKFIEINVIYIGQNMKLCKILKIVWVAASLLGFLAGIVAVYAAWQHNPQQVFHGVDPINWRELSMIWTLWFVVVTTAIGAITSPCVIILHNLFKKKSGHPLT